MAANPEQFDLNRLMQQKEHAYQTESGTALIDLARAAFERREYQQAWDLCQSAEGFLSQFQGTTQAGELLLLQADILSKRGSPDAENYYKRAIAEVAPPVEISSMMVSARARKHLGKHLSAYNRQREARTELRKAAQTYEQLSDRTEAADCYKELYQLDAEEKGWLPDFKNFFGLAKSLESNLEICLLALQAHSESLQSPSIARRSNTSSTLPDPYWKDRLKEARRKWEEGSRPF
ncbi:MAG: hypothetical protein HY651_08565 [Acidobacteria bacterium]|nr:hypothetical protein [Acidobacteriota bacterium]